MKQIRAQKEGETRRRYYVALRKEGYSYRQIAKAAGVTHRTVWEAVHDYRHKMR